MGDEGEGSGGEGKGSGGKGGGKRRLGTPLSTPTILRHTEKSKIRGVGITINC